MQNNNQINQLKTLARIELMGNLKSLVKREKELTLEILDYLQEISNRSLYLEMGFPTLFAFLTEELGYCSGTAYLRIQTMTALKIPENRESVLKDKASLNTLAKTQSFINTENKALDKQSAPLLTESEKEELFSAVEGVPAHKVEEVLKDKKYEIEVKKSQEQGLPPPEKKVLKKFTFEADLELVSMIEELKSLLSHTCPGGDLAHVFKKALPLAIQEIKVKKGLIKRSEIPSKEIKQKETWNSRGRDGKHSHLGNKEGKTSESQVEENIEFLNKDIFVEGEISAIAREVENIKIDKNVSSMKQQFIEEQTSQSTFKSFKGQARKITRTIPVELKRKVWIRDKGCCQYQDPKTGKRCESKYKLELDHLRPWSQGGEHSLENLWVLCRMHNTHRWNSLVIK